jgi:pyroglutamyl-peptidase
MKKLLITGFEPFGGESINPSWEAVMRLPDEINGYKISKLLIPVVFGEAAGRVLDVAEELLPDVILSVGQAGGRNAITVELVAINLRHATIPDNSSAQPQDEPINKNGPNAYFSTMPVRKIANAIRSSGISADVSYSAGTYVCNDVLYTLLDHYSGKSTRVGFIHIPYCKEQCKEPAMDLDDVVKGLMVAIQNLD